MDPANPVVQAVNRALAASGPGPRNIHVCVRSPDNDENIISFNLATYSEVQELAREIELLGYELKLLHPVLKHCDFVLEPQART